MEQFVGGAFWHRDPNALDQTTAGAPASARTVAAIGTAPAVNVAPTGLAPFGTAVATEGESSVDEVQSSGDPGTGNATAAQGSTSPGEADTIGDPAVARWAVAAGTTSAVDTVIAEPIAGAARAVGATGDASAKVTNIDIQRAELVF